MIQVGINGFGRIGKCVFLQLIANPKFKVCAINALNLNINDLEDYLKYDSTHNYSKQFTIEIVSPTEFKIGGHIVKILSDKNAVNLHWKKYGCEYVVDATGCFLTSEKCKDHDVDYVVMSAPAKDETHTFICGANLDKYAGENIVSGSSCTTNCLAPMLKILTDNYEIDNCNFTTIHATTSTQYTVDILNKAARTNRSIFNNIIPHTTGASASIISVLPELAGKINGTSVRVPVGNCSLLDVNVELTDKTVTLKDIENLVKQHKLFSQVYQINKKQLVSCDFVTTTTPAILDIKASIDMGNGRFKLMLWYDNEWSYSAQLVRLLENMYEYNHNQIKNSIKSKYYIENMDLAGKRVVARFDFNVPVVDNVIIDTFRIRSAIPTILTILSKKPKCLILVAHFGRPNGPDDKNSLKRIIPLLNSYLNAYFMPMSETIIHDESAISVQFLEKGIHPDSVLTPSAPFGNYGVQSTETFTASALPPIYLLENVRFHKEETDYEKMSADEIKKSNIVQIYRSMGDVFISDAFGCVHRKHMSICDMKYSGKMFGYGHLIKNEIDALEPLVNMHGDGGKMKILGIIGGNKIKDKLPIIDTLRQIPNAKIFVAGGLAKQYTPSLDHFIENVYVMNDGYGNKTLSDKRIYIDSLNTQMNLYDIGDKSMKQLLSLIDEADVIFWNGSLGVIEDERYKIGSTNLVRYLEQCIKNKKIIIGGGETASLFYNKSEHIYMSTGGGALLEYLQDKILHGKNIVGLDIFC